MQNIINNYTLLIKFSNKLQNPFLLIIRMFWGFCFFSTGLGKLMQIDQVIPFFTSLGIPLPTVSAYLASITELIGGTFLFFGLLSRLFAIPLMITMITAYVFVETDAVLMFFTDPVHFITRTPFTFFLVSLIIFIFGPGKFSIDNYLKKKFIRKKI